MSDDGSASVPTGTEVTKKDVARQLWERLARSRPGPDNKELIFLARFVPLLASGAVKTLLGRKLSMADLRELVQHVPKSREGVVKLVLQMSSDDITEDDLRFVLTHTRSEEVGRLLLKRFPLDANLNLVDSNVESLKDLVEKLRQQERTKDVLREIERKL